MNTHDDGAMSADFIPGIYNYCDRWCARCALTARCRLYHDEPPASPGPPAAAPPADLHTALTTALDALRTLAASHGLNTDAATAAEQTARDRERAAWDHPLAFAARDYATRAAAWLDAHDARLGAAGPEVRRAVQTLHRYRAYIAVKLQRAFRALPDAPASDAAMHPADGSVKVALLAMDRSLSAWSLLFEAFPDAQDTLFPLVVHLERLRRAVEAAFPEARRFLRPGFDRED